MGKSFNRNITDFNNLENKYEVLAPAGSYECMLAAFSAGADAVYVGGQLFGARAFANNFNQEELIEAINYAHLHNKKLFLTINTLLKNQEIENKLIEYLVPLYEAGLEGVVLFCILNTLWWFFPKIRNRNGFLFGLFLILYGIFRFGVEYTREPDLHLGLIISSLSMGQVLCIPMILIGVWILSHSSPIHKLNKITEKE